MFFFRMLIFFSIFKLLFRHCEFSWNSGCHSKHNRNGLLCAMAWIISSVPNRHGRSLFCFNHFLEPLRDRRTSILDRKLSSLSEYSLGCIQEKEKLGGRRCKYVYWSVVRKILSLILVPIL